MNKFKVFQNGIQWGVANCGHGYAWDKGELHHCWCVPRWVQFHCALPGHSILWNAELLSAEGTLCPDRETLWSSNSKHTDHSRDEALAVLQSPVECEALWEDAQDLFAINMLCSYLIPLSLALWVIEPGTFSTPALALAGYFREVWLPSFLSSYTSLNWRVFF